VPVSPGAVVIVDRSSLPWLGLTMLTDVLRGAGYHVLDLGPDTPIGSLVKAIERTDNLKAVCIGVVMQEWVPAAAEMIAAVRRAVGPEVLILVGGAAIVDSDLALSLGADAYAADPLVAVALIEAGVAVSD
jgi:methanogenic corrinoid protein MtbC1